MAKFKVIAWNLLGLTEESCSKPQLGQPVYGQRYEPGTPEYEILVISIKLLVGLLYTYLQCVIDGHGWLAMDRTWRKACPCATLSTTELTRITLGLNLGLQTEKSIFNCLSYGTTRKQKNKLVLYPDVMQSQQ